MDRENQEYRDTVAGFSGVVEALTNHKDEISTEELRQKWNDQVRERIDDDLPIVEG